ncbi:MAG TPA: hypothetical protein VFI20_05530 [Terracidiphilus sp.]|nr:hypothetical protein [Terracidiphilus sp.]
MNRLKGWIVDRQGLGTENVLVSEVLDGMSKHLERPACPPADATTPGIPNGDCGSKRGVIYRGVTLSRGH